MMRIGNGRPVRTPSPAKAQVGAAQPTATGAAASARNRDTFEHSPRRFGVDTNSGTMPTSAIASHGASFVARYLSDDGTHPALTPQEAEQWTQAGVPLVALWETGRQDHVLAGNSVSAAYANGAADARAAQARLDACGGQGKPIYFTVDFNVSPKSWNKQVTDPTTGKATTEGALIQSYFAGIRSVLPQNQVGVYGTNTTVSKLLDSKTVKYAWQQTFGNKHAHIDPRAQLRQSNIYPSQDGWGVAGAGALDYDNAVARNFGQWRSTLVP